LSALDAIDAVRDNSETDPRSRQMSVSKSDMESELRTSVIPWIRRSGFAGSFPHFRRIGDEFVELLTFQFDRNGGGFVVEIARCPPDGIVTPGGKMIPPSKVKAWDLHPYRRKRVVANEAPGTDGWFRFDRQAPRELGGTLLGKLAESDLWDGLGPFGRPDQQHLPIDRAAETTPPAPA